MNAYIVPPEFQPQIDKFEQDNNRIELNTDIHGNKVVLVEMLLHPSFSSVLTIAQNNNFQIIEFIPPNEI